MDNDQLDEYKALLLEPIKVNGFMNFLRVVVKNASSPPDLVVCNDVWNQMSESEKESFRQPTEGFWGMGFRSCPPRKKRCMRKTKRACKKPCPRKPRRKPKCKASTKRRPRNSLLKPGKRTKMDMVMPNNGYLNFLRVFRRKHWNMKPNDLVMKAARAWSRLSEAKKSAYRQQIRQR